MDSAKSETPNASKCAASALLRLRWAMADCGTGAGQQRDGLRRIALTGPLPKLIEEDRTIDPVIEMAE